MDCLSGAGIPEGMIQMNLDWFHKEADQWYFVGDDIGTDGHA